MNDEARVELDRILALSPAELTESEIAFLQARRSYLTEEQRISFGVNEPKTEKAGNPTKGKATGDSDSAK